MSLLYFENFELSRYCEEFSILVTKKQLQEATMEKLVLLQRRKCGMSLYYMYKLYSRYRYRAIKQIPSCLKRRMKTGSCKNSKFWYILVKIEPCKYSHPLAV